MASEPDIIVGTHLRNQEEQQEETSPPPLRSTDELQFLASPRRGAQEREQRKTRFTANSRLSYSVDRPESVSGAKLYRERRSQLHSTSGVSGSGGGGSRGQHLDSRTSANTQGATGLTRRSSALSCAAEQQQQQQQSSACSPRRQHSSSTNLLSNFQQQPVPPSNSANMCQMGNINRKRSAKFLKSIGESLENKPGVFLIIDPQLGGQIT